MSHFKSISVHAAEKISTSKRVSNTNSSWNERKKLASNINFQVGILILILTFHMTGIYFDFYIIFWF